MCQIDSQQNFVYSRPCGGKYGGCLIITETWLSREMIKQNAHIELT